MTDRPANEPTTPDPDAPASAKPEAPAAEATPPVVEAAAPATEAPANPGSVAAAVADPPSPVTDPDRGTGGSATATPTPTEKPKPAKPPPPPPPEVPPATPEVRRTYWLIGLALFLVYLPTLARGATFSDGPELMAAVKGLGVAHPTGYPIFILAGHAFAKILVLPIKFCVKLEIFNALCGAGGAVFTAFTARILARLTQRPGEDPRLADIGAGVAAALLGVSTMLWSYLHIPEVYPLHFFLCTWAGYYWMRYELTRKDGYIVAAALPMGMGLAHHVTMVYMLPAALVYILVRKPIFFVAWITSPATRLIRLVRPGFRAGKEIPPWWGFLAACLVGFLPLLSYYYLIWADSHSPGIPWGDVHNWETLYNHFTGRQYQGFMHKLDLMGHLNRIKVIPDMFDQQFLPVGTVLFFAGVGAAFKRALRPTLFFFVFLLFNAGHGVHYAVGDYGTYYIPGFYCCAVFMAAGLPWLLHQARLRPPEQRALIGLTAVGAMLITGAVTISIYARFTRRLPRWLGAHPWILAVPLAILAVVALRAAWLAYKKRLVHRPIPDWGLQALIAAGIAVPMVPTVIWRAIDIGDEPIIGESYGSELAERIPKGSVHLTQGDGFLFSMWYMNHVEDRGRDFVTLDIANVRTGWFARYVKTHQPVSCDPLSPQNKLDPGGYVARCDSYEKRMAIKDKDTWINLDLVGNRRPFPGHAPANATILRGNDPKCSEKKYLDEHIMKECRCFGYGKRTGGQEGMLEEDCVPSGEERGVVPREPIEIFIQRLLEDYLDERPVVERNALTHWDGAKENPRGWEGPSYQRISATYAVVNRGRWNQFVYSSDVLGFDPCAGEALRELPIRAFGTPRRTPRGIERRRAYVPNERPTILTASWLATTKDAREDAATRVFGAGEPVWARLDWFEKFHWDASKPDKRGGPLHHGVRVCAYDPSGKKALQKMVRSGPGMHEPLSVLAKGAHAPGTWRLRACTTGEVGEKGPLGEDKACLWPILDYDFTVKAD